MKRGLARALGALMLVSVLGAGGCASWRGNRAAPLPELPPVTGGATLRPAWTLALPRAGVGFAPAVAGNGVWAAAADGTVVRVDAASGRPAWRVTTGKPLVAGIGTDGETGVVIAADGEAIAFDANGNVRWRARVGAEATTVPAVALGVALLRTTDNRVIALDAASGERRWVVSRPNPPLTLRQTGGIAVAPETAFLGLPGGRMVALALANGAPRWEISVAQPKGASEIERIADVVGSPLVSGREVCAVTNQGRIGCFDVASGQQRWARDFSSSSGLEIDPRFVFAADADSNVHAFSRTGTSVWRQDRLARRGLTMPLSVGRAIVMGDRLGLVHALSREEGTVLARATTGGGPIVAPPVAADDVVVIQTTTGGLHAFRLE